MTSRVVFIQGGGIGYDQEVALRRVFEVAGAEIEWQVFEAGLPAMEKGHQPLPQDMLAAIRDSGIALKTKLLNPVTGEHPNFNVQLRRELGLFASVRPVKNQVGLPARFSNVDILLIREITEDLYSSVEHEIVPGVVQSLKIVTEAACLRFFRFAFHLAREQGRTIIHCIHKANILKQTDGLVLDVFRRVAREFPAIQPREMIVDNCCMQLVTRPQQFQVLAAGNLYGDLLSDLGVGLVGGIAAALGINHGDGIRVYEAIHGGRLEGIGANHANPLPLLLPALAMLRDLGQTGQAERIQKAIDHVLNEGRVRTIDLGGSATTTELTGAIIQAM
jgi:isocitrate dehydrogenase (NAD+)